MKNPLASELIYLKKEALALKTSHKRGLGVMALYSYDLNPTGYNEDFERVLITIEIDPSSNPFPIIDVRPNDPDIAFAMGSSISSDGMTYNYTFNGLSNELKFVVISSSRLSLLEAVWTSI